MGVLEVLWMLGEVEGMGKVPRWGVGADGLGGR